MTVKNQNVVYTLEYIANSFLSKKKCGVYNLGLNKLTHISYIFRYVKRIILFRMMLFLLFFSMNSLHGEVVEEILFKVNDQIITKMDFEEQSKVLKQTYIAQSEKLPYNFETGVISNMIINILIKQESARQGVKVTDLDVSNHINSIVQINNLGSIENLHSYIITQGMTWEYFFNNQKVSMYREHLLSRIITTKDSTIGEMRNYYQNNKEKEFKISGRLPRVSVIYLRKDVGMTYSEILKLNSLGKKIERELNQGSNFGELAKKYSEDFRSKNIKGDSGWRLEKDFDEETYLWDAIDKLKVGDHSPLISGKEGFYLFKVTDEKTGGYIPFERAKREVQLKLNRIKRQAAYDSKIKEIIREAVIKRKTDRFGNFSLK